MKKIIAFSIAVIMLFSMMACINFKEEVQTNSQTTQQEKTDDKAGDQVKQSPSKQESNTPEPKTEKPAATSKPTNTPKPTPTPTPKPQYSISNEIIVENEYCKVTLVNATMKNNGEVDFKFTLENKTSDKEMMFSMDDTAINGWIISSLFVETVSAGKKANETLSFSASDLDDCGLTSVDKLEFHLRVYDSNDWMADNFVNDTFTVYPTGLTEAQIISPERWKGKDEMVVVDDNNLAFIILGTYEDSIWGYTIVAYIENKTTNKSMMFSWDDVSVNGYMIDPFWATSVSPGNKKLTTIHFSSSNFEENGIEKVEEIEFELRVHDDEDWMAKDFVKDVFTYKHN